MPLSKQITGGLYVCVLIVMLVTYNILRTLTAE